ESKPRSFSQNSIPKEPVHGFGYTPLFAKVVKGKEVQEYHDDPVMVRERGSLNYEGDPVLVGCAKDFKTLSNIHNICFSEGFSGWNAQFEIPDRVVWIDVEGTSLQAWSLATFNRIASKCGELVNMDVSNALNKQLESSPDHIENSHVNVETSSEQLENSPDHVKNSYVHVENFPEQMENSSIHVDESLSLSPKPINGFSILEHFQEFISIGQAMSFGMKGCEKDCRRIITRMGDHNSFK
ncbi:hypothetical protein Tco_1521950, partial [Tanacetum coccineum]